MAISNDKALALASVYSSAMLDLAEAQGEADLLLTELQNVLTQVERDAAIERFFKDPTIDIDARRASIERIFRGKASDLLVDSLQVLNRNGRLSLLSEVAETYRRANQERQGRIEVRVTTAWPLTDALRQRIRESVKHRTKREPELVEDMDTSLIGGLVVEVEDRKFDASVSKEIRRIGRALRDRASREILGRKSYVTGASV